MSARAGKRKERIFVLCLDDFHLQDLETIRDLLDARGCALACTDGS
jgi:hypothetical protein